MIAGGKVQVVVKSQRIPIGTADFSTPIFSISGVSMGTWKRRIVLYESTLNDEHRRAIDEGRKLSCSLGLKLEVVDTSRLNILRRIL